MVLKGVNWVHNTKICQKPWIYFAIMRFRLLIKYGLSNKRPKINILKIRKLKSVGEGEGGESTAISERLRSVGGEGGRGWIDSQLREVEICRWEGGGSINSQLREVEICRWGGRGGG